MINRLDAPEIYPGRRAERIATAVAFLSLDIVRPAYSCLGSGIRDAATFQAPLRQAIESNRHAFQPEPNVVPDLLRKVHSTLVFRGLGTEAGALHRWLQPTLVCGPDDYRAYSTLQDRLSRASRDRDLDGELGISEPIRAELFDALSDPRSVSCLDELYVGLDGSPLSEWDVEVCTRMRFYDDHRDPHVPLHLTCGWLDFRAVVEVPAGGTTSDERAALTRRFEDAARRIGRLRPEDRMPPINDLVDRHA